MDKKDLLIKEKLQQDKEISDKAATIFENLKGEFNMNNNERKVIKISFKQFLAIAASLVVVVFLGGNLYAHALGKPNIYTAIRNLFNVDKEDYQASENEINITQESNGIKLTLKTVAMDDNVLLVKYEAEGDALAGIYTYADFEDAIIDICKEQLYISGWDIGEKYENASTDDVARKTNELLSKLMYKAVDEETSKKLISNAYNAYLKYLQTQLEPDKYSMDEAKKEIEAVVAEYESKVGITHTMMTSNDTLSTFHIQSVEQRIERVDNKYIIHSIYNVDTISELADTFRLDLNISRIFTVEGSWNYSVELDKARLNKRVESIEFFENNVAFFKEKTDEPDVTIENYVTVKKLVISDFSNVIMIQSRTDHGREMPDYTYIITDENDNIVGQGNNFAASEYLHTNRLILKDIDSNTKSIKVKIYSDNELLNTITLDIEAARMNTIIDLSKEYSELNVTFNYPNTWEWSSAVTEGGIHGPFHGINSPEDIDGKRCFIGMQRYENTDSKTAEELIKEEIQADGGAATNQGTIKVGELDGYYSTQVFEETYTTKTWVACVKDGYAYEFIFAGDEVQHAKYYETFSKILETVSFMEIEQENNENSSTGEEDFSSAYEGYSNLAWLFTNAYWDDGDVEHIESNRTVLNWMGKKLIIEDGKVYLQTGSEKMAVDAIEGTAKYLTGWGSQTLERVYVLTEEGTIWISYVDGDLSTSDFKKVNIIGTVIDMTNGNNSTRVVEPPYFLVSTGELLNEEGSKYEELDGGFIKAFRGGQSQLFISEDNSISYFDYENREYIKIKDSEGNILEVKDVFMQMSSADNNLFEESGGSERIFIVNQKGELLYFDVHAGVQVRKYEQANDKIVKLIKAEEEENIRVVFTDGTELLLKDAYENYFYN